MLSKCISIGGLGNLFAGDVWTRIASNPKLAPYLAQPDFVQKVREAQANPKNIGMYALCYIFCFWVFIDHHILLIRYMQDPRMMSLIMGLMGIDASATQTPPENASEYTPEPYSAESSKPSSSSNSKPSAPEPMEVEEELTEEEKEKKSKREASDKEKEAGNALYKKRQFEPALEKYSKAFELDETNIPVLTNKAGT